MTYICNFCGKNNFATMTEALRHKDSHFGQYATIRMSRDLYEIFKLRMEQVGLAIGEMSPGDEPSKGDLIRWLEVSLTLLDVSAVEIRKWLDSGKRT